MSNGEETRGIVKLIYWILGVLIAIVLGGGSLWMNSIQSKLDAALSFQMSSAGRIAVIETIVPYITQRLDTIDRKLDKQQQQFDDQSRRR